MVSTTRPGIKPYARYDVDQVKALANGRWPEILNLPAELLDKSREHPCPKCGGNTRFRPLDDFESTGALFCNHCFNRKNGDGLASFGWLNDCDFKTALAAIAEIVGAKPIGGKKTNPARKPAKSTAGQLERFEPLPWNDMLAAIYCSKKAGIQPASFAAVGGYLAKHSGCTVFALPIRQQGGKAIGNVAANVTGGKLAVYDPKSDSWGNLTSWKTVKGDQKGVIGSDNLFDSAKYSSINRVFKMEGCSDLLAVIPLLQPNEAAFCNVGGARENPKPYRWLLEILEDKLVVVIHDRDEVGVEGAIGDPRKGRLGWATWAAKTASEVKNIELPFELSKTHGKDFRDWLNQGGSRGGLDKLIAESETVTFNDQARKSSEPESWIQCEFSCNELGASREFAKEIAGKLCFVTKWKRWLTWDGRKWCDDSGVGVMRAAKDFADSLWLELGSLVQDVSREEFGKLQTFCKSMQNLKRLQALVKLAESDPALAVSHESLNQSPKLLNVANGTLDLVSGELYKHCPDDLLTQLAPVEYHPDAECPDWLKTIGLVFGDDADLIRYFQQILGYALHGGSPEAILPVWHGSGNNGKSTLWNVVYALLGDYAATASQELILPLRDQHPTERADLFGRRFVMVAETDESRRLAESQVKMLTGDDRIKARRMGENFWEFDPTHLLCLASNHKPRITGQDAGIWRRIKLIPFTVDLSKVVTPRRGMHEWLVENEGPGILSWLVAGYQDWAANGFVEPEVVTKATLEYRSKEDDFQQFLDTRCVYGEGVEGNEYAVDLFRAYQEEGGKLTAKNFGMKLKDKLEYARRKKGIVYLGISLEEAPVEAAETKKQGGCRVV